MHWRTIPPLVGNDLIRFLRNPFFGIITFFYLALFVGIYLAMPASIEDQFSLGIHAPELGEASIEGLDGNGLVVQWFESEEDLRQAVEDDDVDAGLAVPADLMAELVLGARPSVTVHLPDDAPPETAEMMSVLVENLFHQLLEQPAPIVTESEVLGPDLAGDDPLRPATGWCR
jgi:hypothetical protein